MCALSYCIEDSTETEKANGDRHWPIPIRFFMWAEECRPNPEL
jgi:hypothetical protein